MTPSRICLFPAIYPRYALKECGGIKSLVYVHFNGTLDLDNSRKGYQVDVLFAYPRYADSILVADSMTQMYALRALKPLRAAWYRCCNSPSNEPSGKVLYSTRRIVASNYYVPPKCSLDFARGMVALCKSKHPSTNHASIHAVKSASRSGVFSAGVPAFSLSPAPSIFAFVVASDALASR